MVKRSVGLFLFMSFLTTFLSSTFMFVAPLPARFLHLQFGRLLYWSFAVLSSGALYFWQPQWALFQFTLLLVVGLYTDLEQMRVPTFYSALSAIVISSLSFVFLLGIWAQSQGTQLSVLLKGHLQEALVATQKIQSVDVPMDMSYILSLLPALLSIMFMFLIFMSLVFVRAGRREPITAFRAPEYLIWPMITVLAGTFLLDSEQYFWAQKLSCNLLYIFMATYYFQGLAILGFFFKRLRLNYFLKAVLFFILAFHLFAIVIALGVSDFWFNYRNKWYTNLMNKKTSRRME